MSKTITMDAVAAIGSDDEATDWRLMPDQHAKALPIEASPLRRILESPSIGDIVSRFRTADADAVAAQARYKRIGRLGLYAATTATVLGALFLLPVEAFETSQTHSVISLVQISALMTAFIASRWLSVAKTFDLWMKKRAEAEIARVQLFDSVARSQERVNPGEIPLLPLKLEYFRRYQLDVQRRYYRGRGTQHEAAIWRKNKWVSASVALTSLSVLIAAAVALRIAAEFGIPLPAWIVDLILRLPLPQMQRTILALGIIASSLYGLGVALSLMDLDERNASRFLTSAENLEFLSQTELGEARMAAANGQDSEVLAFIDRVQDQISSEHKEWILLASVNRRAGAAPHLQRLQPK